MSEEPVSPHLCLPRPVWCCIHLDTVCDPFTGTGTFLTRLLQIGLIRPEDLERKYRHELFANEIVLLSYYIAAVNIEAVFRQVLVDAGVEPEGDVGFPGISLVDTFAMYDRENRVAGDVSPRTRSASRGSLTRRSTSS